LRTSEKRQRSTTATYVERVNLAIDHVVAHLHEPVRLRDLSRAAVLSPFHFHRVFQALAGATPADFVKRLRLEKALGLMGRDRAPSLTKIAHACGFSSSSDFSRCFKQHFGVAPSSFDVAAWQKARGDELEATVEKATRRPHLERLPPRQNPDGFKVRIRELPARTVAYIRVSNPYEGTAVVDAVARLVGWAERHGLADGQWLGYQWDNPEITALEDCLYHIAVEAEGFTPKGEVGRFRFPPMVVAQVEIRGGIDLELRALQWIYGSWLPRSGYVPDDHPGFEAFIGRPFAHGGDYFELHAQLPIRRA
jgi:AraC family transcriptional regulator